MPLLRWEPRQAYEKFKKVQKLRKKKAPLEE